MSRVGLIILAAGASTRMGSPKQLAKYKGTTLIRHAIETGLDTVCSNVIVVLGARASQVRESINELPVSIVVNTDWEQGMGTSIHVGVQAAELLDLDGIILSLGDLPLLTGQTFNRLIATWRATSKPVIASQYEGTVGVPVFFHRRFFPDLLALPTAQGCKNLILANSGNSIRLECLEALADVDTPDDLKRIHKL